MCRALALRLDHYNWQRLARPKQIPPGEPGSASTRKDWQNWFLMTGRGFGKTRTGAETVRAQVHAGRRRRVAFVAPTLGVARRLMVEGPSGILAVSPPSERPIWLHQKRELHWPNGAVGIVYTTEEPELIRGNEHDYAWCEELGAWRNPRTTWDMLQFCLRITGPHGDAPQTIITSTPRPTELVRSLVASDFTEVTKGTTYENTANLDPTFMRKVLAEYEGSRLGQQELEGKLLGDTPGALFKLSQIEADRVQRLPDQMRRIVVAIDPAVADVEERRKAQEDEEYFIGETGIVVAGVGVCSCERSRGERFPLHAFVMDDLSGYYQPEAWAKLALDAYDDHKADRVIAEVNNGGALVEANLKAQSNRRFAYKAVHASRGKVIRAEPIATLYEKHVVHHVGVLAQLEDQITTWNPLLSRKSPDRLDAMVWGMTELMLEPRAGSILTTVQPTVPRRM